MRRPQAASGDLECGGPPSQIETDKQGRLIFALLFQSQIPISIVYTSRYFVGDCY
jgi:hypothetical protein